MNEFHLSPGNFCVIQERCLRDPEISYEICKWTTDIDVIDSYLMLVYVLKLL